MCAVSLPHKGVVGGFPRKGSMSGWIEDGGSLPRDGRDWVMAVGV